MKKLRYFFTVIFALTLLSAFSQSQNPIKWRMNVRMTTPSEGEVIIKATLDQGWHLYGMKMPEGTAKPTVFDFAGTTGVKWSSDITPSQAPKMFFDPIFSVQVPWWDASVTFRRKFRVDNAVATPSVTCKITFMGCNNQSCLAPSSVSFTKKIIKK